MTFKIGKLAVTIRGFSNSWGGGCATLFNLGLDIFWSGVSTTAGYRGPGFNFYFWLLGFQILEIEVDKK
tara:strand:+ start:2348 stop:2554 length:207 start_codon:yes stop_codon:yes gene_type:complete